MHQFLGSIQAVGVMVILIAIGYLLSVRGKIDGRISDFLSWFVIHVTMPCYMITNIASTFTSTDIALIPKATLLPLITILIGYAAGFLLVRLFRIESKRAGTFIVLTAQNNTIFMGLPINLALFGADSTPFVLYYYMANTILFWTLGIFCISGGGNRSAKEVIKRVFTPPLLGLFIGIILAAAEIQLPTVIRDVCLKLGSMTTGLSMIFVGCVLGRSGLRNIRFNLDILLGHVARFIVGPAISLCVFLIVPMPQLMRNVFIIQSFMPVMANHVIVAEQYGADSEYASIMVSLSTLFSLLILPIVRIFL